MRPITSICAASRLHTIVAEMARVLTPGGMAAAYAWDMPGGGFPLEPIFVQMRALGLSPIMPPSADASRLEVMRDLWQAAGFDSVETRAITVQRRFADFRGLLGGRREEPEF